MHTQRGKIPLGVVIVVGLATVGARAAPGAQVENLRVPEDGIQPQAAVDTTGTLHLLYFRGELHSGNLHYVRSTDGGRSFSEPLQVNSQPGSAVAAGTIRGGQLALGENGQPHVAWNGSSIALPRGPLNPALPVDSPHNGLPLLYATLNRAGTGFAPQANLMRSTFGLDGGGSIAADEYGNVYMAWHGSTEGDPPGEDARRVWVARSHDGGESFFPEIAASDRALGACACCSMHVFAASDATVYALFRAAAGNVDRDMYLLISHDQGRSFEATLLDKWKINACPMSGMALAEGGGAVVAAWETRGQVLFAPIDADHPEEFQPIAAPGEATNRKHPAVARNNEGETLLAWTEKDAPGATIAWQLFDSAGKPVGEIGSATDAPAHSFPAVFPRPDGAFTIIY